MDRPEYVACIIHPAPEYPAAPWCGSREHRAFFTGLDHVVRNSLAGGRLVACPGCVAKAVEALRAAAG